MTGTQEIKLGGMDRAVLRTLRAGALMTIDAQNMPHLGDRTVQPQTRYGLTERRLITRLDKSKNITTKGNGFTISEKGLARIDQTDPPENAVDGDEDLLSCPNCGKKYKTPGIKGTGKSLKTQCKKCNWKFYITNCGECDAVITTDDFQGALIYCSRCENPLTIGNPSSKPIRSNSDHTVKNDVKKSDQKQVKQVNNMGIRKGFRGILGWIFGILFLYIGILTVAQEGFLSSGSIFLLLAVFIFPPMNRVQKKLKINLPAKAKGIILLICFLLFIVISLGSKMAEREEIKKEQQRASLIGKERASQEREKAQQIKREERKREREERRLKNERKNREEKAKAYAATPKFKKALFDLLEKSNLKIVNTAYIDPDFPRRMIIIMRPIWHRRGKHLRKNDAIVFARLWTSMGVEHARISLRSINGDEVGGTKILGGIWVED